MPTRRVRATVAAITVAVVGIAGVLVAALIGVGKPAPTIASAAPPPAVIAAPALAPPQQQRPSLVDTATRAPSTTTKPSSRKKSASGGKTAAECNRIAARSSLSNADLRPYLRSLGCDTTADSLLVGSAGPETTQRTAPSDSGKAALQACREQTGQTTAQCIDQARRGLAN